MTPERWKRLMRSDDENLRVDEIELGWHWCAEFDGLLVGPGMGELGCCKCLAKDHPVYKTLPKESKWSTIPF